MTAQMKDEDIQNLIKLAADLEKAAEEVNKKGDTLQKEVKNLGDATGDTKKQVDDALSKYGELSKEHGDLVKKHGEAVNRIAEIEQTVAQRRQQQEPAPQKSLGEIFVESDAFKSFNGKGNIRVPMNRKDIMNVTATVGSNTSPANSLVGVLRVPGIVMPPTRKLTIRDLVASGQTSQGMVEYAQEVAFTNAAAVVTEGSTKPQSNITFELKTAPVRTIATLFKASRQILDDAPALRSYIDARATYGLRLTEEDELLNGDGTGAHLKGLIPSATAFNAAFVATAKQRMDTIRLGDPSGVPVELPGERYRSQSCGLGGDPAHQRQPAAIHHRQPSGRQRAAPMESAGGGESVDAGDRVLGRRLRHRGSNLRSSRHRNLAVHRKQHGFREEHGHDPRGRAVGIRHLLAARHRAWRLRHRYLIADLNNTGSPSGGPEAQQAREVKETQTCLSLTGRKIQFSI
jgi:HK97 family phage major capsid protein